MASKKVSKYLSYILRHRPDSIDLVLDEHGWADMDELISKTKDLVLSKEIIAEVVESSDKQRFVIKENKIRANQGHSIDVDLDLKPTMPPDVLYHGTATRYVESIKQEGIKSMSRQHVHLSQDTQTAKNIGSRHGKPIVLRIDTHAMYRDGCLFYLSDNGVWLTEFVSSEYIIVE